MEGKLETLTVFEAAATSFFFPFFSFRDHCGVVGRVLAAAYLSFITGSWVGVAQPVGLRTKPGRGTCGRGGAGAPSERCRGTLEQGTNLPKKYVFRGGAI